MCVFALLSLSFFPSDTSLSSDLFIDKKERKKGTSNQSSNEKKKREKKGIDALLFCTESLSFSLLSSLSRKRERVGHNAAFEIVFDVRLFQSTIRTSCVWCSRFSWLRQPILFSVFFHYFVFPTSCSLSYLFCFPISSFLCLSCSFSKFNWENYTSKLCRRWTLCRASRRQWRRMGRRRPR